MKFKENDVEKAFMEYGLRPVYSGFRYMVDLFILFAEDTNATTDELCKRLSIKYDKAANTFPSAIRHAALRSGIYKSTREVLFDIYYKLKHKEDV